MVKKSKIRIYFQYILIYFVITSGGSAWISFLGNDKYVLLTFGLGIIGILMSAKNRKLEKNFCIMILICSLFCFATMGYSSLSIGTYLNFIGKVLLAYGAVNIKREKFIIRFLKLSFILTIVSCSFFILTEIVGFSNMKLLYSLLYQTGADELGGGYGFLIYHFVPLHSGRNCGIFTEPGEHAILLASALFFTVVYYDFMPESYRDKMLLTFLLGMITAQSTSGYFMLIPILSYALISKKIKLLYNRRIWIVILLSMFLFFDSFKEMYQNTISNKIIVKGTIDLTQGTAADRYSSIVLFLNIIKSKPEYLLGKGFEQLAKEGINECAGLLGQLLAVGVFAFTTVYTYLIMSGAKLIKNKLALLLSILIVIIAGLSQPGTGFPVLYIMFLTGRRNAT